MQSTRIKRSHDLLLAALASALLLTVPGCTRNEQKEAPVITTVKAEETLPENNTEQLWQEFMDEVLPPCESCEYTADFLDLDGNGIAEMIVHDDRSMEIYTLENGEIRSFCTGGYSLLQHHMENQESKLPAPPSAHGMDFVLRAGHRTTPDGNVISRWFRPCEKTGGTLLCFFNTTSQPHGISFYYFSCASDGFLQAKSLGHFGISAVREDDPTYGWTCNVNGEYVSEEDYYAQLMKTWAEITDTYGVILTEEEIHGNHPDFLSDTLSVQESLVEEVDSLPVDPDSAILSAAPVGMNPMIYVFEPGLTYYRSAYWNDVIYRITLMLPDGYTNGEIVFAGSGAGSGEVVLYVKAEHGGNRVFLEYWFYNDITDGLQPVSMAVNPLKDDQLISLLTWLNLEITKEEAIALIRKKVSVLYDSIYPVFDPEKEIWEITFYHQYVASGNQKFLLDRYGNILDVRFVEY